MIVLLSERIAIDSSTQESNGAIDVQHCKRTFGQGAELRLWNFKNPGKRQDYGSSYGLANLVNAKIPIKIGGILDLS